MRWRERVWPARDFLACVEIAVALGRDEVGRIRIAEASIRALSGLGMHGLVREIQKERLRARLLEEGKRMFIEHIGDVACFLAGGAVHVEFGIEGAPLAFETDPMIEAGPRRMIVAHMP